MVSHVGERAVLGSRNAGSSQQYEQGGCVHHHGYFQSHLSIVFQLERQIVLLDDLCQRAFQTQRSRLMSEAYGGPSLVVVVLCRLEMLAGVQQKCHRRILESVSNSTLEIAYTKIGLLQVRNGML